MWVTEPFRLFSFFRTMESFLAKYDFSYEWMEEEGMDIIKKDLVECWNYHSFFYFSHFSFEAHEYKDSQPTLVFTFFNANSLQSLRFQVTLVKDKKPEIMTWLEDDFPITSSPVYPITYNP